MSSAQHYKKLTEEKEKQQNKQSLENEGKVMRTVKITRANSGTDKDIIEEVDEHDSIQDVIDKAVQQAERLNLKDEEAESVDLTDEETKNMDASTPDEV